MNDLLKKRIVVTKAHGDLVFSLICALLSVYMLLIGNKKFCKIAFGAVGIVNDRLFPNILAVGLILSLAILGVAVDACIRDKKLLKAGRAPATTEFSICVLFVALIGAFFCLTMKKIGYPLSSIISIYGIYYMLGGRKIWKGAVLSIAFSLVAIFSSLYILALICPSALAFDAKK